MAAELVAIGSRAYPRMWDRFMRSRSRMYECAPRFNLDRLDCLVSEVAFTSRLDGIADLGVGHAELGSTVPHHVLFVRAYLFRHVRLSQLLHTSRNDLIHEASLLLGCPLPLDFLFFWAFPGFRSFGTRCGR